MAIGSRADAGSSRSRTSGSIAIARAMQSRCCWPPHSDSALSLQPILDLVPERGARECPLDALVQALLHPQHARPPGDVVVDGLRERIRTLEDHADPPAHLDRIDAVTVYVRAPIEHLPSTLCSGHQIVHAVQAADEGALSATGRTDKRQ